MIPLIPIEYIEPVFRPPSEAGSLILPLTNGCSWNRCTFCEMYTQPQKAFRVRDEATVLAEIEVTAARHPGITRVFLSDGDAMVLSQRRLRRVLEALNQALPDLERVSAYCLPRNLRNKTVADLRELRALKLDLLYVGAESGDDEVLQRVHKGETRASTLEALLKIRDAGLRSSVMILNGLGGRRHWEAHARHSAELVNAAQPDYLSTLVLSFPRGPQRLQSDFPDFEAADQATLFRELRLFIECTDLRKTVFRSDHASNYLVLKGELGRDRDRMLDCIDEAIRRPDRAGLRPEWARGL